jgi:hypothetical protein
MEEFGMNDRSKTISHPTLLRSVWEGWKKVARKIANVQARVLLFLFYFVILAPFALLARWTGDPLALKPGAPRGWRPRDDREAVASEQSRRQF